MKRGMACAMLLFSACATTPAPTPSARMTSAVHIDEGQQKATVTAANSDEKPPVSRAIAEAQEARLQALFEPTLAQVGQAGNLPTETLQIGFPPHTVSGVRVDIAQNWVRLTETDLQRRIDTPEVQETELKDVAEFVKRQVDRRIHESQMPVMEGGLVSRETVQRYANEFRTIFSQAKTNNEYRVTFSVLTLPKGATFALCREYVPTDCTTVGTNVTLADVFRGRYIYKITRNGYHEVMAPLNLVNFAQSRLWCPLRANSDSAGAVPCTPQ